MKRIGIVGAGAIGRSHKNALLKNGNAELVAVCDIMSERAAELAEGTSARIYTDYNEMQEHESLDAVILNLPHYLHKDVSVFFLNHGIAVLVEKPMAMTKEECDVMIEAAKKNKTLLAVGHVQKYMPCYRKLKEVIKSGELGKLCHITEVRNTNYFVGRPGWFLKKELAGGGIIMNYGPHTLDKVLYVTESNVSKCAAVLNNFFTNDSIEASAQLYARLENGAGLSGTYCGCNVSEKYETHFYFTEGEAKIEYGTYLYISRKGKDYEKENLDYESDIFAFQFNEWMKFLDGEKSEIATAEYGREIVAALDEARERF